MTRSWTALLVLAALGLAVTGCASDGDDAAGATDATTAPTTSGDAASTSAPTMTETSTPSADPELAAAITELIETEMEARHLRAAIVKVSVDGEEILTEAFGESMSGVPATTDMHFRNGAVAIAYVATALLTLVDEGVVSLDDPVSNWLPDAPHADEVTLGQLARMTSGIPDYVFGNERLEAELAEDPFRHYEPEDLIGMIADQPLWYPAGTGWNYAHTNYVILGLALEEITGQPMTELLEERVLGPLGLEHTTDPGSPAIPEPALHAFSSERRAALGIPEGTRFYEESTYWNPSWTITRGAVQTTNIDDLHASAIAIGTGELLSPESYELMTSTDLRGTSRTVDGCIGCVEQNEGYSYGVGLVTSGNWVVQNPMFAGEAGAMAYLPSQGVAIAIVTTLAEEAFDAEGLRTVNDADDLWREMGRLIAPDDPPPTRH